jgi:hypothetical protein
MFSAVLQANVGLCDVLQILSYNSEFFHCSLLQADQFSHESDSGIFQRDSSTLQACFAVRLLSVQQNDDREAVSQAG